MPKKFFTVRVGEEQYRVLFEDLRQIVKRRRKSRPSVPSFRGGEGQCEMKAEVATCPEEEGCGRGESDCP